MKKLVATLLTGALLQTASAQNFSINNDGSSADPSAMLDVKASNKGILIPRTSMLSRVAISAPAKALLVYDTTTSSFWYHNGTAWTEIAPGNAGWSINGNSSSNPAINFLGTTDDVALRFRINNRPAGEINRPLANTSMGYESALANTTGTNNTAMGTHALFSNTLGNGNSALGSGALGSNTLGSDNIALGSFTLPGNTEGSSNTVIGNYAAGSNTTGNENTIVGFNAAGYNVAGSGATAIGYYGMLNTNNTASSFINRNVAVGYEAIKGSPVPADNTGNSNTAIGYQTLTENAMGAGNTACGTQALRYNYDGYSNTAIGEFSLGVNNSGYENTAVGQQALSANRNGYANTAVGVLSLKSNTTGHFNTALGDGAGYSNLVGNANLFLGYNAGYFETGSNKLYIANSNTTTPLIGGDFSTNTVTINSLLTLAPTTTPASPVKGMIYFDNSSNKLRCWDGGAWNDLW